MNELLLASFCCSQEDDEDEDLEDSDDDDTAALLAELEKIKKERAEEQARKVKSHPLKSICFLQTCLSKLLCLRYQDKGELVNEVSAKLPTLQNTLLKWSLMSLFFQ